MTPGVRRNFALAAIAAVLAAVTVALLWLGSPESERLARLDSRRVADLQALARAMDVFWTRHGRLPVSLEELVGEPGLATASTDPETFESYVYRPLDARYELCARFAADSGTSQPVAPPGFWAHGAGAACFVLTPEPPKP